MALNDLELSLMAFPQSWNAATQQLSVNLLMLPVGSPLAPLGTGPRFAGTQVFLNAVFAAGLSNVINTTSPTTLTPYVATPPLGAVSLLQSLPGKLPPGTTIASTAPNALAASVRIRKALPPSYIAAAPFERPLSSDLLVGDGYGCALEAQSPGQLYPSPQAPPPATTTWGELLAYVLHQPQLAMACGLIYQVTLNYSAAQVKDGGWLYFALDTSVATHPWVADFKANSDKVKSYVARIPPLDAVTSRQLFAATLFPIVAAPDATVFTTPQIEAAIYDDGFAQIVHCNQPSTVDAASGDTTQIAPGAEAGLQLGWDDEQVTVWLNRSLDQMRARQASAVPMPPPQAPEFPLGVLGYRVDVQEVGTTTWASLCNVAGSLPFSGSTSNGSGSTLSGELWVAPAPTRSVPADWTSANTSQAWLPLYFSQWRGTSLVVHDDTISKINPGTTPLPSSLLTSDLTGVPQLRYGQEYNFRIRLADLTGGGPTVAQSPRHPGLAPVGTTFFRRYLPPKSLEVTTTPPPPATTVTIQGGAQIVNYPQQPATRTITSLEVNRPLIGYPEALFAGVPAGTFTGASLAALLAQAQTSGRALPVYDPDVDRFQVIVEARIPAHDTGAEGSAVGDLDGNFRVIYSLEETFPVAADGSVTLALEYIDQPDIATLAAPANNAATLPIPTGRDIRIRLQPLCAARNSNYYGSSDGANAPPVGLISDYVVRQEAASEANLFPLLPESQLSGLFFQPGTNLMQLFAKSIVWPDVGADGLPLTLQAQGLTLSAPVGKRVAFGASNYVRCTLAPDGGSITFATLAELLDQWIVAFTLDIDRDWTWDGFNHNSLTFTRDGAAIGTLRLPRTVPAAAVAEAQPDRGTTRLIFFDAVRPEPASPDFPAPVNPQYQVTGNFKSAAPVPPWIYTSLNLPITTNPTQTPKIVATGIAESAYQQGPLYATSNLRDRFLWVEFDQSLADPDDQYFARVLSYGPDPLLAANLLPPSPLLQAVEPALPIDPEFVRVIVAGQSADQSGLQAMTQMISATSSGVHFLLPLPPGITAEALDLFGFWTYEFRVGHGWIDPTIAKADQNLWSTAQGRFGRPLRVTGVQHPAPHLICVPNRNQTQLTVSAPYATTVLNGVRLYNIRNGDPQTVLWFMLYAQVMQADGATWRNVLLARQLGEPVPDPAPLLLQSTPSLNVLLQPPPAPVPQPAPTINKNPQVANREPRASTTFPEKGGPNGTSKGIEDWLSELGLPLNSALSVLAVEMLPGPTNPRRGDDGPWRSAGGNEDPLGVDLGLRRILRTSPLAQVPPIC
jgi:hypothetical protein